MNAKLLTLGTPLLVGICLLGCRKSDTAGHTPEATTTPTRQSAFEQTILAFNRRTLVEAYQRVGMRDPRWDGLAVGYLEDFAQEFTNPRKAPPIGSLLAAGKRIVDLGCQDPLILYCHGVAQSVSGDMVGAEKSLAAAAARLPQSKYPAVRKRFAASRMAYLCRSAGFKRQTEYERWRTQAVKWIVESLQDGSYQAGEQRIFMMHFDPDWNDLFLENREEVYQAIQPARRIDPWVKRMVEGDYWIAKAWEARGSGWAYTVTEEGWKGFHAALPKARTSLTAAWTMHPEYPEAATRMIRVATGEGARRGDSPRVWFDRAIQAQLDYLPAYAQYGQPLLPRWGGSHAAMLNFGSECLATGQFDTAVPYQYYVMLQAAVNDLDSPGTALWNEPAIFTNLQVMCEGYIQSDNAPDRKTAYQTLYASICWRTGHFDAARRILDELGDKVEPDIFKREFHTPGETARAEVYALTGAFADELRRVGTLAASNLHAAAINSYQAVLEQAQGDSNVTAYVRQNIETLKTAMKFSQGDWVPLTVPKDLTGWSVRAGTWKVGEDGAVVGESTRDGLLLVCNQPLSRNVEIKGEFLFIIAPYKFKVNGGLAVGSTDKKPEDFYSCLLYQAEREASAGKGRGFRGSERLAKAADVKTGNTMLMRVRDNQLTLLVNDSLVLDAVPMVGYEADESQRVGVGGYYWYPGAMLRFWNLQVRSLKD